MNHIEAVFDAEIKSIERTKQIVTVLRDNFGKQFDDIKLSDNVAIHQHGNYPRVRFELNFTIMLRHSDLKNYPWLRVKFNLNCGIKKKKAGDEIYIHPNCVEFYMQNLADYNYSNWQGQWTAISLLPQGYSSADAVRDAQTCLTYLQSIKNDYDICIKEIKTLLTMKTFDGFTDFVKQCQKKLEQRDIMKDSKRRTSK